MLNVTAIKMGVQRTCYVTALSSRVLAAFGDELLGGDKI